MNIVIFILAIAQIVCLVSTVILSSHRFSLIAFYAAANIIFMLVSKPIMFLVTLAWTASKSKGTDAKSDDKALAEKYESFADKTVTIIRAILSIALMVGVLMFQTQLR